ncbi:MAG: methyl-accepting chemotaxis protein [Aquabacterium sp.]|nr:methyl-accepting chemotaxis protein [Aquabacterium sp.]
MSLPGTTALLTVALRGGRWRAAREFFAYHGVWAFGVRAMRLWSLRMKMLLLVTVMSLPLLPLMVQQIVERNDLVQESAHRIAGLRVSEAIFNLGGALDLELRALESGNAAPGDALPTALAGLRTALQWASDEGLQLEPVLRTYLPVLDRAARSGAQSPASRLGALLAARQAMAAIRQAAVEASRLLLNLDPVRASLANLAVDYLPTMRRDLSILRSLTVRQAALLGQTPPPVAELNDLLITAAGRAENVNRLIGLSERALDMNRDSHYAAGEATLQASQALLTRLRTTLLAPEPQQPLPALRQQVIDAFTLITQLQRKAHRSLEGELHRLHDEARSQRMRLFGALALTTLLAAYLVYSFFLVMRGGLAKLNHQMIRMAQGDLSARPMGLGGDEVADTLQAMTTSLARLSDLLASVRQGVGSITQASEQIAAGNGDLSSRSRRNAAGLDQLVAAVTRYTDQLQTCSRSVEEVVTTVQTLRLASVRNRRQVQRLQERMTSLRGNSREIGEIVNLIDNIAFRTNILALNASVEASKAGESGRGFAVVAQEVRALATRSADSARRVSEIVSRSTLEIEQGKALADETGLSIQDADGHVDKIHTAMSEVAALTKQGDVESAAILEEIKVLKDGTAKNLGLVDQLAVASDALRGQGERLSHKVGLFKLS